MAHTSPGYPDATQRPGPGVISICSEQGWQAKYIRCRDNYRAAKATIRIQAAKSRQLIAAVTEQLHCKDEEIKKLQVKHDKELSVICQQLLFVHGCLLRERERVTSLVQEKDRVITDQRIEIERTRNSTVTVSGPALGVGLERVRPGSIRQHGSFRQYKKEKIRQRNYNSSSESNLSSSTGWNGSSEESSESSPRQARQPLRLTLSSGSVENNYSDAKENFDSMRPRKGILKSSSSYGNLSSSAAFSCNNDSISTSNSSSVHAMLNIDVLENLQNMLRSNKDFATPSLVKSLLVTDCSPIKKEERSDSGRESEESSSLDMSSSSLTYSRLSSISSLSSSSGIVTDSPNSSFDASDPTTKVVIEIRSKTKPPAPPPRSSSTKLSTDSPTRRSSPGDALDILIYDKSSDVTHDDAWKTNDDIIKTEDSDVIKNKDVPPTRPPKPSLLKKVKFNPEVDCKSFNNNPLHSTTNPVQSIINPHLVKPLDPNFLHFLPKLTKSPEKSGISYFEPYL